MEKISEFHNQLHQVIKDAREKLNISDATVGFILMQYTLEYYENPKSLARRELKQENG